MAKEFSVISIVDDDEFVRASIRGLLRSCGFTVEAFSSATEFLAFPNLEEVDCLIADINMPAITGVELFRTLTKEGHAIPTILITAYPDDAVRTRALSDGVLCYLEKPFDDNDLMHCVQAALDGR